MRLAGTTVLLTAGAGRCQSLALGLSREGARVLVHDEDARSAEVARAVRDQGGACEIVAGKVESVAEVDRMVEDAWRRFAPIRGVVLAPGPGAPPGAPIPSEFLECGLGVWQSSLATGLAIPFFLVRALASRMGEGEGGGAIVSIVRAPSAQLDSIARVVRGGLVTMTRGLAKVLPDRVRIAAVYGGSAASRSAAVAFLLGEPSLASGTIVDFDS